MSATERRKSPRGLEERIKNLMKALERLHVVQEEFRDREGRIRETLNALYIIQYRHLIKENGRGL